MFIDASAAHSDRMGSQRLLAWLAWVQKDAHVHAPARRPGPDEPSPQAPSLILNQASVACPLVSALRILEVNLT